MIKLIDINYSIGNTTIIRKFNLNILDNKINCILGPSGSGKTTLLNILAKTISANSGHIDNMPNDLAYVFQEERLIAELTVYQNIRLVLLKHFPKALNEMNVLINKYLTLVNLYQVKDLYPHELSGSMRQRLSLARAFVCSSKVLVMDEPFGGIDVMMKKALISDIIKLWNIDHPTVIFVTHDLDEAILMSDVIHVMGNLPIHLIRTLKVNGSKTNRKINSRQLTLIKNQIYHLIKNWV